MSTTKLAEAARAVIDRWDSPMWKDAPHTGEYIHALRQALASYEAAQAEAKPAPAVEPVARVEQVKSSTQFRLIWLQEPVEGVLYAAPVAPAPAITKATGEQA